LFRQKWPKSGVFWRIPHVDGFVSEFPRREDEPPTVPAANPARRTA
jgi:hypothetical protein